MGASVEDTGWGPWPALRLADEALSVVVVPAVGGRVVSLLDRRTGREWLAQGDPPSATELEAWMGEEAVFGGRESFGWDECLPSVSPCQDPTEASAGTLRDHGDQWGRAASMALDPDGVCLTTAWASPRWPIVLERRLTLEREGSLRAQYTLASRADRMLPVLWSAHPVLDLEPGTRIELPGVSSTRVTGVVGWPHPTGESVPWPEPVAGLDLSAIRAIDDGGAAKLYAATTAARAVTPDGAWIRMEADGETVRTMGIWLDAGGWPPGGPPVRQTALEPTSSPDDHLGDAIAHDRAWDLPAGGTLRWWMRVTVGGR